MTLGRKPRAGNAATGVLSATAKAVASADAAMTAVVSHVRCLRKDARNLMMLPCNQR